MLISHAAYWLLLHPPLLTSIALAGTAIMAGLSTLADRN